MHTAIESEKIILSKGSWPFEEGSLGYKIFPDILEGRVRALKVLTLPDWRHKGESLSDLLEVPFDVISSKEGVEGIRNPISQQLLGLAVTNQARLLGAIFGREQSYVPLDREVEVAMGVDAVLQEVADVLEGDKTKVETLVLHFGLDDGVPRTYEEIGKTEGISRQAIGLRVKRAMALLRQSPHKDVLSGYLSFSPTSFARKILGVSLYKDIPYLSFDAREGGRGVFFVDPKALKPLIKQAERARNSY